jgi:hypothetical protein
LIEEVVREAELQELVRKKIVKEYMSLVRVAADQMACK